MGVPGTVGFFKRHGHRWSERGILRDMSVVIDITGGWYWFVLKRLLESGPASALHMDKYGTSMTELGQFYRDFFKRLRERNCRPIVVWDGYRKAERYGRMASKAHHLESSSRGALNRLNSGQFHRLTSLPELATSCLKEIVNECGLGADQLHQAIHEVYPVLERLARENNCPVITSHSDFIFSNVPKGFIWFEELDVPSDSFKEFGCTVYSHESMMRSYNLEPGHHSEAVRCLSVILRDDFASTYHRVVNQVLALERTTLSLGARNFGTMTRRLELIMNNWPRALTTAESVRAALVQHAHLHHGRHDDDMLRDFDATWDSYSRAHEFHTCELAETFASGHDHMRLLHDALVHRESTADFLANLTLTSYRRTNIQDVRTFRSTYSLCDRFMQYLIERIRVPEARLFDRENDRMDFRSLDTRNQAPLLQVPLTREILFLLVHFDERRLDRLAEQLSVAFPIDIENTKRLALLLLLARYVLKLVGRDNYDNTDQFTHHANKCNRSRSRSKGKSKSRGESGASAGAGAPKERSHSNSSGSDKNEATENRYERADLRRKFLNAILNSYVYHLGRMHQGDQSNQEVPADIRVARGKIDELAKGPPSVQARADSNDYITCKHLVEALNSTLHGYKELNSLYEFVGPNILVNKYYDGVLIYKLMTRMSKNLASYLLTLDDELYQDLIDF